MFMIIYYVKGLYIMFMRETMLSLQIFNLKIVLLVKTVTGDESKFIYKTSPLPS